MEGIVQGPALAVQAGNLIPELPVGVQKLVEVITLRRPVSAGVVAVA